MRLYECDPVWCLWSWRGGRDLSSLSIARLDEAGGLLGGERGDGRD